MLKRSSLLVVLMLIMHWSQAQRPAVKTLSAKPKLVVGLVIDQMRWDYLYRYKARYGSGGFNRLLSQGYSYENTMIPYVPTYTAVGHSSIYTGGVPATTGIVGNNWYDRNTRQNIYCTQDSAVHGLDNNDYQGKMSPDNLWATTVTDELRLSNNFQSKVIGISLKDRGAILPAGHTANAAYWLDEKTGKWISSSYYMNALPGWVTGYNAIDKAGALMRTDWSTLYPINTYTLSAADAEPYENVIPGEASTTFPHKLGSIVTNKFLAFKYTPFASSYSFDFAKQAITDEQLGAGPVTDFLALSISSTDYAGHSFGPNSIELEDTYLRLDQDIAGFLSFLDKKLGQNNYLLFLSADHGAAHIPAFLNEHGIPAGVFSELGLQAELNKAVSDSFGLPRAIVSLQNYQVYLDDVQLAKSAKEEAIKKFVIDALSRKPFIAYAFELKKMSSVTLAEPMKTMVVNGFNPVRSGDIQFIVKPGYFDGSTRGTTHGLWNPYDAHIPLVFFGWQVPHGKSNRTVYMTDIAPTVAAKLQVQMPSGSVGKVLEEVMNAQ